MAQFLGRYRAKAAYYKATMYSNIFPVCVCACVCVCVCLQAVLNLEQNPAKIVLRKRRQRQRGVRHAPLQVECAEQTKASGNSSPHELKTAAALRACNKSCFHLSSSLIKFQILVQEQVFIPSAHVHNSLSTLPQFTHEASPEQNAYAKMAFQIILREPQHTPVSHTPSIRNKPQKKRIPKHKLLVGGRPGMFQGYVGKFLESFILFHHDIQRHSTTAGE